MDNFVPINSKKVNIESSAHLFSIHIWKLYHFVVEVSLFCFNWIANVEKTKVFHGYFPLIYGKWINFCPSKIREATSKVPRICFQYNFECSTILWLKYLCYLSIGLRMLKKLLFFHGYFPLIYGKWINFCHLKIREATSKIPRICFQYNFECSTILWLKYLFSLSIGLRMFKKLLFFHGYFPLIYNKIHMLFSNINWINGTNT